MPHPRYLCLAVAATLLLAPGGASAATGRVSDLTAIYTAARGETNDVTVGQDLLFTDPGATLVAGTGCFLPSPDQLQCQGGLGLDAYLRDGDDHASVSTALAARVWGGSGDDTLWVDSPGNSVAVNGDGGTDHITTLGETGSVADGGLGNDTIEVHGFSGEAIARGGAGDDTIDFAENAPFNVATPNLEGGLGDDTIVSQAMAGTVTGGDGYDSITITGAPPEDAGLGSMTIGGGAGNDTITGGLLPDIVDGGSGRDVIDVSGGGSDTVTCGTGIDRVRFDASDAIGGDCEIRILVPSS